MIQTSEKDLLEKIRNLEDRLEESEQLIEAIKAGEVDAFAIHRENESEVYTLHSGDYAYRVLIEEFGEGAVNVSEEGLIVYTNPYFFGMLQMPYEKVVGCSFFEFVHEDSQKKFQHLFESALSGRSKGEINLEVNDVVIPVYISLTSLQPKLATVGIIITDFSEKKRNEETILAYQKDLEFKNRELVKSNSELASFAYIASHDLQEPLRKIRTFVARILEKEYNNISDNGKEQFDRMQVAAIRMQSLIEDLLAYSRTNTVERRFENTHLHQVVGEVREDMKEELQQRNAVIEEVEMCSCSVIPFQLRQLLYNLISNSIKFTAMDKDPHIKIKSKVERGSALGNAKLMADVDYCHISVSDNGIGFEQQYGEKIFDLFQRLHGQSQYTGTGIGLAIVKKIVENHNGIIVASSELNHGATFDIYIPT